VARLSAAARGQNCRRRWVQATGSWDPGFDLGFGSWEPKHRAGGRLSVNWHTSLTSHHADRAVQIAVCIVCKYGLVCT
jgi:hypothetical protein